MTLIESVMKESACCATQASLFTRLSGVFLRNSKFLIGVTPKVAGGGGGV